MNKIVFSLRFNGVCYVSSYAALNPYIYDVRQTDRDKSPIMYD